MKNVLIPSLQHSTEIFIAQHFLTAAGISPTLSAGPNLFMLKRHTRDAHQNSIDVVTLENWSTTPDNYSIQPVGEQPLFPLKGYWIPQGESAELPATPGPGDPKFAFTPDFTGCSLMIDKLNQESYRVYHVQGGHKGGHGGEAPISYMDIEYNNEGRDHGMGLTYSSKFSDYGTESSPRAFIFMKYDLTLEKWCVYTQSQNGLGVSYNSRTGDIVTVSLPTIRTYSMRIVDII
ncbi:hypothetical protein F0A16_20250 [Salinicola corii]|uniref:Uncharacterized protein n=1 Tax=Salinicola corii TaxID=2606937 RepID=A0A640W7J9_9GAMM|nr:hypothetical protein [Salinicola corii]KAA0015540.1 hypothetical protein F0A16_20250 [Salinicola corii]